MADMVQIKNSNLDSNNWVNLFGATFQVSYKIRNKTNPLDGQFTGTNYNIATADKIGVENPVITIRGMISTHEYDTDAQFWLVTPSTSSSTSEEKISMANYVTMGYLRALARDMTGTTLLKISFGDPDAQFTWKNWDGTTDEIPVEVDSILPVPKQDSEGNHFIDYVIKLTEVSS